MTDSDKKPTVLIVLDGWGYREDTRDNAIANGDTPVWDRLWAEAPHTLISGSGLDWLDRSLAEAVWAWEFEPAERHEQALAASIELLVEFELE